MVPGYGMQPVRDIACFMQNPPYIDAAFMLDVEDQIGKTLQGPGAQPGQIEFVCVA